MSEDISFKDYWRYRREMTPTERSWFMYYFKKFKRLAMNVYTWSGLPDTVDPYLIERYLFEDGQCIIWNDPKFGVVVAKCNVTKIDAWRRPLKLRPTYEGVPNVQKEIDIDDCIYITDMYEIGAKRRDAFILLSELIAVQNVIDTQNTNQASPLLAIGGSPTTRQKLKNCIQTIANGFKVMFVEDDITKSLKPLNLNGAYNVPTLVQYKKEIENEILSYLGVDSQQAFQKKERMIVDEQEGNDELLNYFLSDGLKGRQRALEGNSLGISATVEIQGFVRPEMKEDNTGADENGSTDTTDN